MDASLPQTELPQTVVVPDYVPVEWIQLEEPPEVLHQFCAVCNRWLYLKAGAEGIESVLGTEIRCLCGTMDVIRVKNQGELVQCEPCFSYHACPVCGATNGNDYWVHGK